MDPGESREEFVLVLGVKVQGNSNFLRGTFCKMQLDVNRLPELPLQGAWPSERGSKPLENPLLRSVSSFSYRIWPVVWRLSLFMVILTVKFA